MTAALSARVVTVQADAEFRVTVRKRWKEKKYDD